MSYKISIMGDSISTYEGYNPWGSEVYYKGVMLRDNYLKSVDDTWWMQVIKGLGGELCMNESFSGCLVSGNSEISACSKERCFALHGETTPDIILVYVGTNDRGWNVEIDYNKPQDKENFYGAYRIMLSQIKSNYPQAKIICGTLLGLEKYETGVNGKFWKGYNKLYNDAIKKAVEDEGCILADLASFNTYYASIDGLHPNADGHKTMSKLWLKCINL